MKLETVLDEKGIDYRKQTHRPVYTAQTLAREERVGGRFVAKPVVVRSEHGYTMFVLPAPSRLDLRRAAEVIEERELRLATETEMAKLFPDCELGAEPPIGSLYDMETVIDEQLHDDDFVVMQSGKHTEAITMRREDWESLCHPKIAPLSLN